MTTKRKQILKAIAVSGCAVRREAGDSACDLYAPVNPVTTFQEDV